MPKPRTSRNFNLRKDPVDTRDYKFTSSPIDVPVQLELPITMDLTSDMSPVKDQGNLGSCVGFALSAMKEWQEQREHKEEVAAGKKDHRDEKYYDLSEQWVYYMSKEIDPWPNDEGTSIRYAMKVLNKIGVPVEKAWPYNDAVRGEPKRWANLVALWSLIGSYYRIETLNEIKQALNETGPVPIGVPCFEEIFYVGVDGIVHYPQQPQYMYGGHAICVCGYDDVSRLVKFKNSWSPYWGDHGYGYLPYTYIKDFLWDAWACKDLSVTRNMLKEARSLIG